MRSVITGKESAIVEKCMKTVPKKLITDVGEQDGAMTVVTRGFDVVGENKYLEGAA